MKARATAENAPPLLKRVNFVWYAVLLVPILAVGWLSLNGTLPGMALIVAIFGLCFWLFSLAFALYERFVKKQRVVDYR
jgi:hypothetical protein